MNLSHGTSDDMYDNVSVVRKSMFGMGENSSEFGSVIYSGQDDNDTSMTNFTDFNFEPKEYIFDRKEVRVIFITLYSLVFCCCFFGEWFIPDSDCRDGDLRINELRMRFTLSRSLLDKQFARGRMKWVVDSDVIRRIEIAAVVKLSHTEVYEK